MKRNIFAAGLLLAAISASAPAAPPGPQSETPGGASGTPAARPQFKQPAQSQPVTPPPEKLDLETTPSPAARGMYSGRIGDPSGYQSSQQPVTGAGVDPDTGKQPEREFNGLRFGTSVDDAQRLGPRAR